MNTSNAHSTFLAFMNILAHYYSEICKTNIAIALEDFYWDRVTKSTPVCSFMFYSYDQHNGQHGELPTRMTIYVFFLLIIT
jgi:hypothetical protein